MRTDALSMSNQALAAVEGDLAIQSGENVHNLALFLDAGEQKPHRAQLCRADVDLSDSPSV